MTSPSRSRPDSVPGRARTDGFTLIEMAISMFIMALIIGALLVPLATQSESRQMRESERVMNEMLEAVMGFAITQQVTTTPRLPCPDRTSGGDGSANNTANDGVEDRDGATCLPNSGSEYEGNLPWSTLGVNATDAWGNRIRYRVTAAFANPVSSTLSLSTTSTLSVCRVSTNGTSCDSNQALANPVPVVLVSHGLNGSGAMNGSSNVQIPVSASTNEAENSDNDNVFISREKSNVSGSEFDDIVVWLSPSILFSRLVNANRLP